MVRIVFHSIVYSLTLVSCIACVSVPRGSFGDQIPEAPDYSTSKCWAALPMMKDSADAVPVALWRDEQSHAAADIFFIHPTTYTGKAGQKEWNGDVYDQKLNERTDRSSIRYQASLFNGSGRIYAPRYRQAHLHCFYTQQAQEAKKALDLAYEDVRKSFAYYLEHYNEGRPFIIAAHSQGTYHGKRLIRDFIDGTPLQKQFVVAYLAGLTVPEDIFDTVRPCQLPEETGCFCSWRTFRTGYKPRKIHFPDTNIVVTNPVTWNASIPAADKEVQLGGVLRDFEKVYPHLVNTRIYKDLLWVNKPRFPGSFLLTTKNYHIADYNFFYADVRKNAQDRVKAFLRKE